MEFDSRKKTLEAEKSKLFAQLIAQEKPEDFGDDVDDEDEETNESESFGNQLAMARILKMRINEIDAALARIETGSYGICEACGKKIEEKVLDVSPESRLCQHCKKGK